MPHSSHNEGRGISSPPPDSLVRESPLAPTSTRILQRAKRRMGSCLRAGHPTPSRHSAPGCVPTPGPSLFQPAHSTRLVSSAGRPTGRQRRPCGGRRPTLCCPYVDRQRLPRPFRWQECDLCGEATATSVCSIAAWSPRLSQGVPNCVTSFDRPGAMGRSKIYPCRQHVQHGRIRLWQACPCHPGAAPSRPGGQPLSLVFPGPGFPKTGFRRHIPAQVIFKQGEMDMGDKGKRDKGKKEHQKKAQLSPKEKRKQKKEKKNK